MAGPRPAIRALPRPIVHAFHAQTDDGLAIEAQALDARHPVRAMSLHGHAFFELVLICDGRGWHRVNGRRHRAVAGRLFVLAPGDVHACDELGSATGWMLLFGAEALGPRGPARSGRADRHRLLAAFAERQVRQRSCIALTTAQFTRWRAMIERISGELDARESDYRSAVRAILHLLLIDLARLERPSTARLHDAVDVSTPVERALRFIDAQCLEPISARDVAAHVGRSAAHLTTAVRTQTGLPIGGWIARRRLEAAQRLLLETDLSVDEVAARVRYGDAAAFGRAFRRVYRTTPGAWRAAHRASFAETAIDSS